MPTLNLHLYDTKIPSPSCGSPITIHAPVACNEIYFAKLRERCEQINQGIHKWQKLRDLIIGVGRDLEAILLSDESVKSRFNQEIIKVESSFRQQLPSSLHLHLSFGNDILSQLPWELLYDTGRELFVSASDHIVISRAMNSEAMQARPKWRPPLRLLVVMASPMIAKDPNLQKPAWGQFWEPPCGDTLSFERFMRDVGNQAKEELVSYRLLAGRDATPEALHKELQINEYDVFYFIGHSLLYNGITYLLLESGSRIRHEARVSDGEIREWLRLSGVSTVVFSSCNSFAAASSFRNFEHLEAVVGMQMAMPFLTGAAFDEAMIESLAAWQPIETCVLQGRRQTRNFLKECLFDHDDWGVADRPDWAVPVLFTRSPSQRRDFSSVPDGTYQIGLDGAQLIDLQNQFGSKWELSGKIRHNIRPSYAKQLRAFQLSRWPVTNHQYRHYLEITGISTEKFPDGFERPGTIVRLNELNPSAPVVGVTWAEANAFCKWAGSRLPRADEWEAAARGPRATLFPWGDDFRESLCKRTSSPSKLLDSVFSKPQWVSHFNIEAQCCGIFEWTEDQKEGEIVIVGCGSPHLPPLPSLRALRIPEKRWYDVGFRCVLDE